MNDEVWFYGDQILDECTAFSYLGVTFTACGITNYSIDVLTGQAKKALATLYANMQSIGRLYFYSVIVIENVCIHV